MIKRLKQLHEEEFIFLIDYWLLVTSIFLWRLPIAFGYRYHLTYRAIGLIPAFFAIFLNIFYIRQKQIKITVTKKTGILLGLFLVCVTQATLRTAFQEFDKSTLFYFGDYFSLVTLLLFAFFSFEANRDFNRQDKLRRAIIYAFGLYIFLNVLFKVLNIDPHDPIYLTEYPAQLLALIGMRLNRVLFPMASGINSFGLLSGAVFVGLFQLFRSRQTKFEKFWVILMLLLSASTILLTDSRGAVLFTVISIILMFLPRKLFMALRWGSLVISALPLMLFLTTPQLIIGSTEWINRPQSDWVERPATDLDAPCLKAKDAYNGSLSNRPVIWDAVINDLKKFEPEHIIGYGIRGHVVSSLSNQYSCLFTSYADSLMASSHNIWLQLIVDLGYLGLLITILLIVCLIINISRFYYETGAYTYLSLLNVLLYIIMIGALEAPLAQDFYGTFMYFILISTIVSIPQAKIIDESIN